MTPKTRGEQIAEEMAATRERLRADMGSVVIDRQPVTAAPKPRQAELTDEVLDGLSTPSARRRVPVYLRDLDRTIYVFTEQEARRLRDNDAVIVATSRR